MGFFGLEYIFQTMNIHKLCSEAFSFNTASLKFHQKLGFVEEGCFKADILKNGEYQDIICLAFFQDQWLNISNDIAKRCFGGGIPA
jgi:RimJ/RimL family protein N-acetyltransferase